MTGPAMGLHTSACGVPQLWMGSQVTASSCVSVFLFDVFIGIIDPLVC